jgi:hypothetical protein
MTGSSSSTATGTGFAEDSDGAAVVIFRSMYFSALLRSSMYGKRIRKTRLPCFK